MNVQLFFLLHVLFIFLLLYHYNLLQFYVLSSILAFQSFTYSSPLDLHPANWSVFLLYQSAYLTIEVFSGIPTYVPLLKMQGKWLAHSTAPGNTSLFLQWFIFYKSQNRPNIAAISGLELCNPHFSV